VIKPHLTTKEAAHYLGLAPATLACWRVRKSDGPRFVRLGRAVRYRVPDLDAWLEANSGTCNADFREA
jgi:excisionase family DNA binding protein